MDDNKIKYCPYCGHDLNGFQINTDSDDAVYNSAVELAISSGNVSTSLIQKKLRVGYARASRMMERMQEKGIIGPSGGAKPRKVLAKNPINDSAL